MLIKTCYSGAMDKIMQMLFMDLDEAFICTSEIGLDLSRDPYSASSNSPAIRLHRQDSIAPILKTLHERLMLLAGEELYPEALVVIQTMMDLVTQELGISREASKLNKNHVGHAVMKSMTLFRFHLLLLKTEAYLHSQLGDMQAAIISLEKVLEFDGSNRLGARELLELLLRSFTELQRVSENTRSH